MTTFIKTKLKISDDQTNIDKYRLAANITLYHRESFEESTILDLEVKKQRNYALIVMFKMDIRTFRY